MDATVEHRVRAGAQKLAVADQHRWLAAALAIGDVVALVSAFFLAYGVRFYSGLPLFVDVTPSFPERALTMALLLPVWLIALAAFGLYAEQNLLGGTREYALVFNASTAATMVAVAFTFFSQRIVVSRGWLVLAWLLGALLIALSRFGVRRAVYWLRRKGHFLAPAVIVGAGGEGRALAQQLRAWDTSGLRIVGFVDDEAPAGTPVLNGLRVLGGVADVPRLVDQYGVEEVVVASSCVSRQALVELARAYALSDRLNVRLSSGLFEILTTGVHVKEVGFVHLICLDRVRLNRLEVALKTMLDCAVCIPLMVLLLPVGLAIAAAIRLDSPGPVLHRRRVLGKGGRVFYGLKFRTMVTDGDEILAAQPALAAQLARDHKLVDDPRVTRVGKVLRRFSLDELPQVVNVLRREMSLVGPRMITPAELDRYGKWDMNLLTVWPGMTGLWQVSGRSEVSYDERVELDMHYIRNYSIWLDLFILAKTVPAVVRGRGAR